jgi:hypothetical protein
MIGRGAGDLGEVACKVCVEIRFQGEARKAAGIPQRLGGLRLARFTARKGKRKTSEGRRREGSREGAETWRRGTFWCRNHRRKPSASAISDEEFRRIGGISSERTKGRWRRGDGATYRHRRALETGRINAGLNRGVIAGRFRFPGREERAGEEGADMWVRSVSGRGGPDERGPPVGGGTRERGIPFRV